MFQRIVREGVTAPNTTLWKQNKSMEVNLHVILANDLPDTQAHLFLFDWTKEQGTFTFAHALYQLSYSGSVLDRAASRNKPTV